MLLRYQRTRRTGLALAVASIFTIQGCSWIDPYPDWKHPKTDDIKALETYTLPYAITYAQNARSAYRSKLSAHAMMANSVGPGLIALGATALGLAAYGASTDAILGVALGGGTTYTIANWFDNNTHELVYLEGMQAMSCAIGAVLPLNFSTDAKTDFKTSLDSLNEKISATNDAMGVVRARMPASAQQADLVRVANAALTSAEQLVRKSDETYAKGQELYRHIDAVGTDLVAAVESISDAVDAAVQRSQPRLGSLTEVMDNLSGASDIFAPGLGLSETLGASFQAGATAPTNLVAADLNAGLGNLAKATISLQSSARQVIGTINSVREKRPHETLKNCGASVEEFSTDIALSTERINAVAETPSEHAIIVTGGKTPYVAGFTSSSTPGVTVQSPIPAGDRLVRIVVAADATEGEHTIYIADAAGHSKTVIVSVAGKP